MKIQSVVNESGSPAKGCRTILVLGGSGFIGRHVVAALQSASCTVVISSRKPERIECRGRVAVKPDACRRARFENLLAPEDWVDLLKNIDVVVNCVGILRQRGQETYERVHHLAPAALVEACRRKRCRLIHVSALGLDNPVRSRFLRSKREGEEALRRSGADWFIVRPSLLDGEGGFGARWIRRVARWPIHFVPADAAGRIAALDVRDLGEALARLALLSSIEGADESGREFELGGTHQRTLAEHLAAIRRLHTTAPAWCLRVPAWLARVCSHLCDMLHWTPYSFGHWELLRHDNCPRNDRLVELLGRPARPIGRDVASAAVAVVARSSSCSVEHL